MEPVFNPVLGVFVRPSLSPSLLTSFSYFFFLLFSLSPFFEHLKTKNSALKHYCGKPMAVVAASLNFLDSLPIATQGSGMKKGLGTDPNRHLLLY